MPNFAPIDFSDIRPGMTLDIAWEFHGRGIDRVTAVNPDGSLEFITGTAHVRDRYSAEELKGAVISVPVAIPLSECIEHSTECNGVADYHASQSGLTSAIRCDFHWIRHCERMEKMRRDYPDSPFAPSWFDPSYAGEVWDDTDY